MTPVTPNKRTPRALVISLLTMLVVLVGVEVAFRQVGGVEGLAAERRFTALPGLLSELQPSPHIAFLGDSRTIHGVHPLTVERVVRERLGRDVVAVNLGLSGAPPTAHLGWARRLAELERPPEVVVFLLSPYMLSTAQDQTLANESVGTIYRAGDALTALRAGMPVESVLTAVSSDVSLLVRYRRRVIKAVLGGEKLGPRAHIDARGYTPGGRVALHVQKYRADSRAKGTAAVLGPEAELDPKQVAYLEAAARELRAVGSQEVWVTPPTASRLWEYFTDETLYGPSMRTYRELAQRLGIELLRYRDVALVDDRYFSDGDHLNPEGARRMSAKLTHTLLLRYLDPSYTDRFERWSPVQPSRPGCEVLFDFETVAPTDGWRFEGGAFRPWAVTGAQGTQGTIAGARGMQLLNSYSAASDLRALGTAQSPPFEITRPRLSLLVGGGTSAKVDVSLIVDGRALKTARGKGNDRLSAVVWDLSGLIGKRATLRIRDADRGAGGYVMLDQVEACD